MNATMNVELDGTRNKKSPPAKPIKVLCVDDQPSNLMALEASLADLGLDFVKASSGQEALRCVLRDEFALILMDVRMPEMDGFETAEYIRQRERSKDTPIIFITASERDEPEIFKGYSLGAVDYLCKPIQPRVLHSKVSVFVDIHRKALQIKEQAEIVRRLEHQEHQRELAQAKERWEVERLREEIRLARQIQQKLFPVAPLPSAGFDISGASYPAEATGGDYFDYIPMRDGALGVVIGDVSGHGFGPALLMAELRAYLRAFILTRSDVGEIVGLLNCALADDAPEGHFATLLLVRFDPGTGSLEYASAGHWPGYVFDSSGTVKSVLNATGMPLAAVPSGEFPTASVPALEAGELILLVTDGIVEAHGPEGSVYGIDRVFELVRTHHSKTAREIIAALYNDVRGFGGAQAQLDDMTAVVIKAAPAVALS